MGIEECAREERYRIFEELMQKEGFPILVTAHHADDNLETLLLHMTRGASADGLCGIRPVRPFGTGHLVRPMLSCQKADILEFCEDYDLPYVTDSTNADTAYARNRLRAEVTPVLRTLNPRVATATVRLCADAARDADCLGALAEELLRSHMTEDGIALSALQNAHEAIASRALCSAFLARSGGVSLSHVHVDALLALVRAATPHASCDLPMHLCAVVEGGRLRFDRRRNAFPLVSPYEQELFEGVNVISQTNFEIFIGDSQTPKNVYKNSIRLYINPATIEGRLMARNRRSGDAILCGGKHKDVRRLFSAHALPLALRQSFPILCDDNGILAVPSVAVRDGSAPKPSDPRLGITIAWE
jgi:tRNA(Ile)-lysidine synthase